MNHDFSGIRQAMRRSRILLADEPFGLDRIRATISAIPGIQIVGSTSSGAVAKHAVASMRPDLVIVNVEMLDCSGFEIAAAAGAADIVFLAHSTDFAADAFRFNAVDYLLKPVECGRLQQAVARARQNLLARQALESAPAVAPPQREGLWIKTADRAIFVPLDDITRIEAHGEYVLLHAGGRSHMTRLTMHDLEVRLEGHGLMRVHRSAFVRLKDVVEVKRNGNRIIEVLLRCGGRVAVGAMYTKFLSAQLGN